ncbi:MAG: hypothetical protein ACE5K8_06010 [Candidatus Zixiibacteriota bacterium]
MKQEVTTKDRLSGCKAVAFIAIVLLVWGSYNEKVFGAQGAAVREVQYTVRFSQTELSFGTIMGYDLVRLDDGDFLSHRGQPMLPT